MKNTQYNRIESKELENCDNRGFSFVHGTFPKIWRIADMGKGKGDLWKRGFDAASIALFVPVPDMKDWFYF